jgi:type I restriction-modification system DNA methylase subunit
LKKAIGLEKPDFGVLDEANVLCAVIECKNDFRSLDQARDEACAYADKINDVTGYDVKVAIAVAGTPDTSVQTRSFFRKRSQWIPLTSHGYPLTQIPTPTELRLALENNDGTTDVQLPAEKEFFDAAIAISRILRLAKVDEPKRPKVVGAIILAMYHGDFSLAPDLVINHINSNVSAAVEACRDVAPQRRQLLIQTLALSEEMQQLPGEIPVIVRQLERLNIRSIMRSGVDFLGKFYEAFLRYGCDSTAMGIVLTPRHITKFCAELLDVQLGASVYDPACGTGGFLVAAYDRMMAVAHTPAAIRRVKESLWGSDTNSTVWALAILNMMFRGDGKSNIDFISCFKNDKKFTEKFNVVLLNPPYSQEGEPETDFIDHSLRVLVPGGLMACVVKTTVVTGGEFADWRRALVADHHVLGVISLPADLFYPTGAPTVILLVKAHAPNKSAGTFLARIENDGFDISKNRRVPIEGTQLPDVLALFHEYQKSGSFKTIPNLACVVPRDWIDNGQEICAEQWLPSSQFSLQVFEKMYHESIKSMSLAVANYPEVVDELVENYELLLAEGEKAGKPNKRKRLSDWFDVSAGKSIGSSNYPGGEIPFISSGDNYNGIVSFIHPPDDEIHDTPQIAVTGFGQAYLQPWRFAARGNGGSAVRILTPRFSMTMEELFWMVSQINAQKWRFHYGRMAIQPRLRGLEVDPPPSKLPTIPSLAGRLRTFKKNLASLF